MMCSIGHATWYKINIPKMTRKARPMGIRRCKFWSWFSIWCSVGATVEL